MGSIVIQAWRQWHGANDKPTTQTRLRRNDLAPIEIMDALADVRLCGRHVRQHLLARMRDQRRRRLCAAKTRQRTVSADRLRAILVRHRTNG
jgi:hypothetical protein